MSVPGVYNIGSSLPKQIPKTASLFSDFGKSQPHSSLLLKETNKYETEKLFENLRVVRL